MILAFTHVSRLGSAPISICSCRAPPIRRSSLCALESSLSSIDYSRCSFRHGCLGGTSAALVFREDDVGRIFAVRDVRHDLGARPTEPRRRPRFFALSHGQLTLHRFALRIALRSGGQLFQYRQAAEVPGRSPSSRFMSEPGSEVAVEAQSHKRFAVP
jgi:hypothetical protein